LLEKLPRYSLEDAKTRATFFFSNLTGFKDACVSHLDFYGIGVVEKRELLSQYVPESADPDNWRDEVVAYLAQKILSMRTEDVKLLIKVGEGDEESIKVWGEIVQSGKLDDLARILARRRIRPKHGDFDEDTFLGHLRLVMAKNAQEFSLAEIETSVESLENEILTTKYRIEHSVNEFRLDRVDLSFVSHFQPSKLSDVSSELLNLLSAKLSMDIDLLLLLHSVANGLEGARELWAKMAQEPKVEQLARLLIERAFIARSTFTQNIVPLLRTQSEFNLTEFVSLYARYDTLGESLENFLPFLIANGVLRPGVSLSFQDVLQMCPVSESISLEDQLFKLSLKATTDLIDQVTLDAEQHSDLALASTALFLRTHGYSGYSSLCQLASRREFACQILFECITLVAEQRLSGTQETLKEATSRALKGTLDVGNYDYFKTELADGKLAPSASFLFSKFKEEVMVEFKKLQDKGFETQTLVNFVEPIKELLYQGIDEKVVREFLLAQVLSAYLLTVPGAAPGIGFISNHMNYIRLAENELARNEKDTRYNNMVQLSTGGGKATRIGLVPSELSFDEFSKMFNDVWTQAVGLHNDKEPNKVPVPLPCYLIRIFPSDDGLKEIMPSEEVETRPLEVVRELIRDSVTGDDSVSLLSLIQKAPTGRLALIKVIQAIIDSPQSSLLMMVADQVRLIIAKSDRLLNKFEKKEIDSSLFREYDVENISSLGRKVADRSRSAGLDIARTEFRTRFVQSLGEEIGVSPEDVDIAAGEIFKRLRSIGIASNV
jgi:hypothetical protein